MKGTISPCCTNNKYPMLAHKIFNISTKSTIIIGMDDSHGSPRHADLLSISMVYIFYMLLMVFTEINRSLNLIYVVML